MSNRNTKKINLRQSQYFREIHLTTIESLINNQNRVERTLYGLPL